MNGSETILAVIACCAMLAAVLMAAFAYRLNEKWAERNAALADICDKQNELMERMNTEWLKFYDSVRRKEDGRD
jgi:predicted  nucleic acid-binding Zn-ribbon protein